MGYHTVSACPCDVTELRVARATQSWSPGSHGVATAVLRRHLFTDNLSKVAPSEMLSSATELLLPQSHMSLHSSVVVIAVVIVLLQSMGMFIKNFHVLHRNPIRDDTILHLPTGIACFTPLNLASPVSETKQEHPARAICGSKETHCPHLWFPIVKHTFSFDTNLSKSYNENMIKIKCSFFVKQSSIPIDKTIISTLHS